MAPVATTAAAGISTGTIVLVGGVILIAGAIFYLKNSNSKAEKTSVKKILTDENRYKGYKSVIEDAIKEEDWETLEDMLSSRTSDFPDLIQMIKKALNNR